MEGMSLNSMELQIPLLTTTTTQEKYTYNIDQAILRFFPTSLFHMRTNLYEMKQTTTRNIFYFPSSVFDSL